MSPEDAEIIAEVGEYYTGKLREHGASPRGVDWNGEESQRVRFDQLLKVAPERGGFSLLDYGCGYGALLDHLGERTAEIDYVGFDISEEMVIAARERHEAKYTADAAGLEPVDFVVASGIFNVRLEVSTEEWERYVTQTLDTMRSLSIRGFAFNMLTAYSDADRMRDYLYYPEPTRYFDLCKRRYSRNVALLHDYELYEFTILVRLS